MREAPSLVVVEGLLERGAEVVAHDPEAHGRGARRVRRPDRLRRHNYDALPDADALVIVTEWKQYRVPDFPRIRELLRSRSSTVDGRNLYGRPRSRMRELGFDYSSIRPAALEQIDLAVDVNPRYVEAHINRALLLQELGRYEEARRAVRAGGCPRTDQPQAGSRRPSGGSAGKRARNVGRHVRGGRRTGGGRRPVQSGARAAPRLRGHPQQARARHCSPWGAPTRPSRNSGPCSTRTRASSAPGSTSASRGTARARIGDAAGNGRPARSRSPVTPQARAYLTMLEGSQREAAPD
jgi:hypothetical protein